MGQGASKHAVDLPHNTQEVLAEDLDLLEERQEMVLIRLVNYQQKLAQRYDWGVKPREFFAGERWWEV